MNPAGFEPSGIRTRSSRKRAVTDPRLRPRGHQDPLLNVVRGMKYGTRWSVSLAFNRQRQAICCLGEKTGFTLVRVWKTTECLVSTVCVWILSGSRTSLMVLTGPATGPNPLSCCPLTGLSTVCHNRTVFCCRARWLREIGFVGREYKRWYHQKPKCADNSQGFVSVRIQDFYPALVVFAYGVALSLVILILEIAYSKLQRRCRE